MENFNFEGFFEWFKYWIDKIIDCVEQTKAWFENTFPEDDAEAEG